MEKLKFGESAGLEEMRNGKNKEFREFKEIKEAMEKITKFSNLPNLPKNTNPKSPLKLLGPDNRLYPNILQSASTIRDYHRVDLWLVAILLKEARLSCCDEVIVELCLDKVNGAATEAATHNS